MKKSAFGAMLGAFLFSAGWLGCNMIIGLDPPANQMCLWTSDPGNCYRRFRIDTLYAGTACEPVGSPSPVDMSNGQGVTGISNGFFPRPDKLDVCILGQNGGTITFEPGLATVDPGRLTAGSSIKMTFRDAAGTSCGSATYDGLTAFSFTINSPPGVIPDAGVVPAVGDAEYYGVIPEPWGTYSQQLDESGNELLVTCPSEYVGEFDPRLVSAALSGFTNEYSSVCGLVSDLTPRSVFGFVPAAAGKPGAVSFSVFWPPAIGVYPSSLLQAGGASPLQAERVTYFNCLIPAVQVDCTNGIADPGETDKDCGGAEILPGCPARCAEGQTCLVDCDCARGLGCVGTPGSKKCMQQPESVQPPVCTGLLLCENGQRDAFEGDLDCGQVCAQLCDIDQSCFVNEDCFGNYCFENQCKMPSCNDGKQNVGETDVDCGGPCASKCKNGAGCLTNIDCDSGNCVNLKCGDADCTDQVQNGFETDVDCGGGACPKCDNLKTCLVNSDCKNYACVPSLPNNGQLTCRFPSCTDSTKDGDETDKDCGGSKCGPCADGLLCDVNAECTSNICGPAAVTNGLVVTRCFPTSCIVPVDGGMGGGPPMMTQLCGGMCPLCNDGGPCTKNSDCLFQACIDGTCTHATCFDNVQDGAETDKDCGGGGACSPCNPGQKCLHSADCDNGVDGGVGKCLNNVCQ